MSSTRRIYTAMSYRYENLHSESGEILALQVQKFPNLATNVRNTIFCSVAKSTIIPEVRLAIRTLCLIIYYRYIYATVTAIIECPTRPQVQDAAERRAVKPQFSTNLY